MIHVNLAEINEKSTFSRDFRTMIHEFIHALGFSAGLWGYYISPDGKALIESEVIKQKNNR